VTIEPNNKDELVLSKAIKQKEAQNWDEAFDLFSELAGKGHASAQHHLADLYLEGKGIAKNSTKAMALLRAAASQGFVASVFNIACLYESGEGVPQSLADAYFWFRKAARYGDEECPEILEGIDQNAYDKESNAYQFNVDGRFYTNLASASVDICSGLNESIAENLMIFLQSRWPEAAANIMKEASSSPPTRQVIFLAAQIGLNDGYSFLADVIDFLDGINFTRIVGRNPSSVQTSTKSTADQTPDLDTLFDDLLTKFDEIVDEDTTATTVDVYSDASRIIGDDSDNFEQFGLEKLIARYPTEALLAVKNRLIDQPDMSVEEGITLLDLCKQIQSRETEKFLDDLREILSNMYSS
jgi:hypothetical protein